LVVAGRGCQPFAYISDLSLIRIQLFLEDYPMLSCRRLMAMTALAGVVVLGLSTAAEAQPTPKRPPSSIPRPQNEFRVLAEEDSGRRVTIRPGTVVYVVLSANPSTGYLWVYNSPDEDGQKPILALDYDRFSAGLNEVAGQPMVGAGGVHLFAFTSQQLPAVGASFEHMIRINRFPPGASRPDRTLTFDVVVSDARPR
jgi:predicted secreted protein